MLQVPKLIKTVVSSRYTHPELGPVNVRVVATARSMRARWEGPVLHVTIPKDCPASAFDRFIDNNIPAFLEMKPEQEFHVGQIINGDYADFEILADPLPRYSGGCRIELSRQAPVRGKKGNYRLYISQDLVERGVEMPYVQNFINKALLRAAEYAVERFVIPRAEELAGLVGRSPAAWAVKYKKRSLGTCDTKGIITLSPRLAFLPGRLRDFVILHELAHLSEMNHSAAFHQVCDSYCGGHEAELRAALKRFRFPVR